MASMHAGDIVGYHKSPGKTRQERQARGRGELRRQGEKKISDDDTSSFVHTFEHHEDITQGNRL